MAEGGGRSSATPAREQRWATAPPPAPAREQPDEEARTQYYTRSHRLNLPPDEFHCLEIAVAGELEKRFVVNPLGLRIGRTPPADVILADGRVSRTHCLVELAGEHLRVTDLNSTNGTFIDGKRIEGAAPLHVGSVLKVGSVTFTHVVRSSADV